jgi:uncharacterized membrane protein (DUF441 family)
VPFADERVNLNTMLTLFLTAAGVLSIAGGALAAKVNKRGLHLLRESPELMVGILIGSLSVMIVLKDVPLGPFGSAGVTYYLIKIFHHH